MIEYDSLFSAMNEPGLAASGQSNLTRICPSFEQLRTLAGAEANVQPVVMLVALFYSGFQIVDLALKRSDTFVKRGFAKFRLFSAR